MGLGGTIRGWLPAAWPEESGLPKVKPGVGDPRPRSPDPAQVRSPQEALVYIEALYKSGRMGDLAALLRRSQVFREAWLLLQQPSPSAFEVASAGQGSARQEKAPGSEHFPVPGVGKPGPALNPDLHPEGLQAAKTRFAAGMPALPPEPAAGTSPPGGRAAQSGRLLTLLLQSYRDQDRYYTGQKDPGPRINIRV